MGSLFRGFGGLGCLGDLCGLRGLNVQSFLFSSGTALFGGCLFGLQGANLGLLHDLVDLIGVYTAHFGQYIRFDHREIVVREEPFADELLGQLVFEPLQLGEADHGLLDLFVQLLPGHDFDVPDAELAGEPDVLSTAPDGQRQLILAYQHDGPT